MPDPELSVKVTLSRSVNDITPFITNLFFDALIENNPATSHYLDENADIVASSVFEHAITKIQLNKSHELDRAETEALPQFKADVVPVNDVGGDYSTNLSFADAVLAKRPRNNHMFTDVSWIQGTSNIVERLFSRATTKTSRTDAR